jgi:hypothetical protein
MEKISVGDLHEKTCVVLHVSACFFGLLDPDQLVRGTDSGSGSFPFLLKVLRGLKKNNPDPQQNVTDTQQV